MRKAISLVMLFGAIRTLFIVFTLLKEFFAEGAGSPG